MNTSAIYKCVYLQMPGSTAVIDNECYLQMPGSIHQKKKKISEDFTDEKQTSANLTHRLHISIGLHMLGGNDAFGKIGEKKMEDAKTNGKCKKKKEE